MNNHTDNFQEPISTAQALALVKPYFLEDWQHTTIEQVQLRQVTGGFVNRLVLLTRSPPVTNEPARILIRFFGLRGPPQDPPESKITLSAAEQALVYNIMSQRGWGPQLYGIFPGGRLEEWIDAHPLTPEESKDPAIRRDIARSYARLHSLNMPLRKNRLGDMLTELRGIGQRTEKFASVLLENKDLKIQEFASILKSTNWVHELLWVYKLVMNHKCRRTFVIGDANYLNILVKDYKSECQVMLIDYETLGFGFRGLDIGGHFNERMYSYDREDSVVNGHPAPDLQEQLLFCEAYLQEFQKHGIMSNLDTVGHLLIESKIGRMFHILFSVLMCFHDGLIEVMEKPVLSAGLTHMMKVYFQLKVDFN